MRKKNHTTLVLLLLGIGLPCIILGLLALRGLKNDQALQEKDIRQSHRALLDSVRADLSRELRIISTEMHSREDDDSALLNPGSLIPRHSLCETIFCIDTDRHIYIPRRNLLYDDDSESISGPGDFSSALLRGHVAEFQEKDLTGAERIYRTVQVSGDDRTRPQTLFALARLQRRQKKWPAAVELYREIRDECSSTRLPSGLPAAPAACLEEGLTEAARGDSNAAIACWLCLLEDLVDKRWRLTRSQYDFFSSRAHAKITELTPKDSTIRHHISLLAGAEQQSRRITGRLHLFREVFPALFDQSFPGEGRTTGHVLSFRTGDQLFLVLLTPVTGASVRTWSHIGYILNQRVLADDILPRLIGRRVNTPGTGWTLNDTNGAVLSTSGSALTGSGMITGGFRDQFPPWTVTFFERDGSLIPLLFSRERSLYGPVFLVIIIILIVTIIWAVHTFLVTAELAETKTRFAAALSHDLKSPLTSIRQVSEMLRDGRVKPERRSAYFRLLARQSERLTYLMDNILDATGRELGRRRVYFEIVDPERFLKEFTAEFAGSLKTEGFTLHLSIEKGLPTVQLDKAAIQQALTNLVDNARKYSPAGSTITIRAGRANKRVFISVSDHGQGIDAATAKQIFRPYYRGPAATKAGIPGSGLGLSLVKSVMDSHKGRIRVESTPGKGTVFFLEFPK